MKHVALALDLGAELILLWPSWLQRDVVNDSRVVLVHGPDVMTGRATEVDHIRAFAQVREMWSALPAHRTKAVPHQLDIWANLVPASGPAKQAIP